MADDGADVRRQAEDLWIKVVVRDEVPVLYPQAARVLCRIVVGLARKERGSEAGSQAEGRELERRRAG
jgi:hypothetical protein